MAAQGQRLKLAAAALLMALAVLAGIWMWQGTQQRLAERAPLGLMTSLPIYWPEGAELQVTLESQAPLPWVRRALEERYELVPLDSLSAGGGADTASDPLARFKHLLIAQPRGLSPADNVSLDEWVRRGGRLLLVLDPMLTGQYAVPIGDPRHPVAVGLIPPVLIRWGLDMRFSENQPFEPRQESYGDGAVPVLLAGEVVLADDDPAASEADRAARGTCRILGQGIAAQCEVGQGRVTVLADAALLELAEPHDDSEAQLEALTNLAFD